MEKYSEGRMGRVHTLSEFLVSSHSRDKKVGRVNVAVLAVECASEKVTTPGQSR